MKTLKIVIVAALCLSVMGCEKEGNIGPQGPTGATGATGEQGPAGQNGQDGEDGNANVIALSPLTLTSITWEASGNGWIADFPVSEITQDVVNTGMVKVFRQYGAEWWALPDINGSNVTQYGFSLSEMHLMNTNMDGTAAANPGAMTIRIVIIPSGGIIKNPTTDWNDYHQIEKLL